MFTKQTIIAMTKEKMVNLFDIVGQKCLHQSDLSPCLVKNLISTLPNNTIITFDITYIKISNIKKKENNPQGSSLLF